MRWTPYDGIMLVVKMLSRLLIRGSYARVGITHLATSPSLELIVAFGAGVLISAVSYCNRCWGATRSSETPGGSSGNMGFRCVRVANTARIEAVDSPTWGARRKRPGTAP